MQSLESRLENLDLTIPRELVARALVGAAVPRAPRRPLRPAARRVVVAALSLGVFVGGNVVSAQLWPAYGHVLADLPGGNIIPRWLDPHTGLVPQTATQLDSIATSAGHEVHLIGGSADGARTLLFFEIDGKSYNNVDDPPRFHVTTATITDAEGNVYGQLPYGHNFISAFAPLQGEAANGGPLTLHVTELLQGTTGETVSGAWTLPLRIVAQPPRAVSVPPAISVAGTRYEIVAVTASREVLEFSWRAAGTAVDEFAVIVADAPAAAVNPGTNPLPGEAIEPSAAARAYAERIHASLDRHFRVTVVAPSGQRRSPFTGGTAAPKEAVVEGSATILIEGPGRYVVRFGTNAELVLEIR